jgi:hypothetical protein
MLTRGKALRILRPIKLALLPPRHLRGLAFPQPDINRIAQQAIRRLGQ